MHGLLNIQFALVSDVLYVLEANPRASRTVPFVSKATGVSLAKAAALVMAGRSIADLRAVGILPVDDASVLDLDSPIAVKEAVLPFKRFRTKEGVVVDTVLGPEMRSTGEVMGFDVDFPTAFAKSQDAAFGGLPTRRAGVHLGRRPRQALDRLPGQAPGGARLRDPRDRGHRGGAAPQRHRVDGRPQVLVGSRARRGSRRSSTSSPTGEVDIVVNTPSGQGARADGYEIRAATTAADKAMVTTVQQLGAAVQAIEARAGGPVPGDQPAGARRGRPGAPRGARGGPTHDARPFGAAPRGRDGRARAALRRHRPAPEPAGRRGGCRTTPRGCARFALTVLEAVGGQVAAVKPQAAFFERHGSAGVAVLEEVVAAGRDTGTLVIVDAKRGDIGSTMGAYADAFLRDGSPLAGRRADGVAVPRLRVARPGGRPGARRPGGACSSCA